jgi:hypothetical protein
MPLVRSAPIRRSDCTFGASEQVSWLDFFSIRQLIITSILDIDEPIDALSGQLERLRFRRQNSAGITNV